MKNPETDNGTSRDDLVQSAAVMFLGMAHATSAVILRWRVEGVVAGLGWAGGVATYFVPRNYVIAIYVVEMVCCMVLFGGYAMMLERRCAAGTVQSQVRGRVQGHA